jgi:hypothetical protein
VSPLLAGFAGSNLAVGMDVFFILGVVCCQVEVSAPGRQLVQRSPTDCGVSVCDFETSTMGGIGPLGCSSREKKCSLLM